MRFSVRNKETLLRNYYRKPAWGWKGEAGFLTVDSNPEDLAVASCPKCGRQEVRKDTAKRRRCRRCGVLPGPEGYGRSGEIHQFKPASKGKEAK